MKKRDRIKKLKSDYRRNRDAAEQQLRFAEQGTIELVAQYHRRNASQFYRFAEHIQAEIDSLKGIRP